MNESVWTAPKELTHRQQHQLLLRKHTPSCPHQSPLPLQSTLFLSHRFSSAAPPVIHLHFSKTFPSHLNSLSGFCSCTADRKTQKHCPLCCWIFDATSACLSSDGPCPESCDDAHFWAPYGEDKASNHLLQCLSNTFQFRGMTPLLGLKGLLL